MGEVGLRAITFNVMAVGFFGLAAYLLLTDASWSAAGRGGTALLAAFFCAFIGSLDRFKQFEASVSGVKATMQEAKVVVNEAKAALEGLRALGAITGRELIRLATTEGRLVGRSASDLDAQRANLLSSLRTLGLSEEALAGVEAGDRHWVVIDYAQGIFAGWAGNRQVAQEVADAFSMWVATGWRKTPDECEHMVDYLQINNPEKRELLEDYKHYTKTGKHRRPEVWTQRDTWMRG